MVTSDAANEAERLKLAQRAYEAGDFAQANRLASALISSSDASIAEASKQLVSRVAIDPVALGVLGCAFLLFLLTVKAYVF